MTVTGVLIAATFAKGGLEAIAGDEEEDDG